MQEPDLAQSFELRGAYRGFRIVRRYSDPDDPHRDVDSRVSQDVAHESRHDAHTVQVAVEVVGHRLRDPALLPAEVLTGDASR